MERIKQALERARAERESNPATDIATNTVPAFANAEAAPEVAYSQTRHIEVSDQELHRNRLIAGEENSRFADAYKMLRTQVLQRLKENGWNVVAITSPGTGEGKTTTAMNLAISLALEVRHTVLLVDANLRHPSIHKLLGLPDGAGLTDYLLDDTPLQNLLVRPEGIEHVTVLPAGRAISNSAEMLNSPKMAKLAEEMKSRYPGRIVLFDLPPVLNAPDTLAFMPCVDAALLVVEEGKTRRNDVKQAVELLANTPVLGTVLNKRPAKA
jgi:exopolysaccharide/PEP-CTERM locus tyrosine autokinase